MEDRYRRSHATPPPLNRDFLEDDQPQGLYRSRDGVIFGVCAGMANYLDFSVGWTRVLAVIAAIFSGFWPVVGVYVLAALLIKPEPVVPFKEESDMEFYDSFMNSRTMALSRLKRTFEALERRIGRMEGIVTARDYDWEQRLND
jgi:phage shock protein C